MTQIPFSPSMQQQGLQPLKFLMALSVFAQLFAASPAIANSEKLPQAWRGAVLVATQQHCSTQPKCFTSLEKAVDYANKHHENVSHILVANGTYTLPASKKIHANVSIEGSLSPIFALAKASSPTHKLSKENIGACKKWWKSDRSSHLPCSIIITTKISDKGESQLTAARGPFRNIFMPTTLFAKN